MFDRKIRMAHLETPSYAFNIMTTNAILNLTEATEMAHSNQDRAENKQSAYWQAVLARDASQDGKFVFAVSSTGVYCRPSCPARRPRRENVTFFGQPDQAEKAGYRACLRCRPKAIGGNGTTEMVKAMCRYIEQHLDEPLTLARLGIRISPEPIPSAANIQARAGHYPSGLRRLLPHESNSRTIFARGTRSLDPCTTRVTVPAAVYTSALRRNSA